MTDSQPIQGGYIKGKYPWGGVPIVHMIAGDFLVQACHINLHDDATHTITSNYDEVTCVECRVGWMQYQRDDYKASCLEAERKAAVAERAKEIAVETAGKEVAKNLDLMAENRGLRTTLEHLREQKERQSNTIRTLKFRLDQYEDDDGQPINPAQPTRPEWMLDDIPVHEQFPLCLKRRSADGMRCSMPYNHGRGADGISGHYFNLELTRDELTHIERRDVL